MNPDSYQAMLAAVQAFHDKHNFKATGGEELAILLNGKISKYPYRMRNNYLIVYPAEDNRMAFSKRTGPLVQVPMQWAINEQIP